MNGTTRQITDHGPNKGISLIEVLVGLAILMAGLLTVAAAFPRIIAAQHDAELLTMAAALAQMKSEEIRRDNDRSGVYLDRIRNLTEPTVPVTFPHEPRLSYSLSGVSVLHTGDADPADPRAMPGVARVIIRLAPTFDPDQDVIYELRFN